MSTERGSNPPEDITTASNASINSILASEKNDLERSMSSSDDEAVVAEFGDKIDSHIPNGGLMAWLQVLGSLSAIIMTFGVSSGTSVLMQWLSKNYLSDMSTSKIGWMFSVQLFLFYFLGVLLGPIVDAVGVRLLVILGSVFWIAALFIMSACKEYYQFVLCFSILGGFSSALLFNPSVTVLTHWFSTKRGFAIGIAATGSGIGGIVYSQISSHLLPKAGFGWAVRAIAFVVLFLGCIACLTLRSRHKTATIKWHEMKPDVKALMEPDFFFCVLGLFFVEWGIFIPKQYIVPYAVMQGFTPQFGTNLVSYYNTASVIARICTGFLSDRLGAFNLMIVTSGLSGIICLVIWLPAGHTKAGLTVFCVLFGIFSGAVISLALITVPQLSNVKNCGRRYGTAYMIASFAVLTGIPLAGSLTAHRYLGVMVFTGCTYLAGSLCYLISRYFAVGWKPVF